MRYSIYPLVCMGYHLTEVSYVVDKNSIPGVASISSFPYANSDNCEGWESTTHFKFNGDGKSVVWLCPECAKRWNKEKQERINLILEMATKVEYLPKQLQLYNDLLVLGATKEQKWQFNENVCKTERDFKKGDNQCL